MLKETGSTIRRWHFVEDGVRAKYCHALRVEVVSFSESISGGIS